MAFQPVITPDSRVPGLLKLFTDFWCIIPGGKVVVERRA